MNRWLIVQMKCTSEIHLSFSLYFYHGFKSLGSDRFPKLRFLLRYWFHPIVLYWLCFRILVLSSSPLLLVYIFFLLFGIVPRTPFGSYLLVCCFLSMFSQHRHNHFLRCHPSMLTKKFHGQHSCHVPSRTAGSYDTCNPRAEVSRRLTCKMTRDPHATCVWPVLTQWWLGAYVSLTIHVVLIRQLTIYFLVTFWLTWQKALLEVFLVKSFHFCTPFSQFGFFIL
jgi:hypothetical protein